MCKDSNCVGSGNINSSWLCDSCLEEAVLENAANFGASEIIHYRFTTPEEKEFIQKWLDENRELMGSLAEMEEKEKNRS
jgi:hypothetical protein